MSIAMIRQEKTAKCEARSLATEHLFVSTVMRLCASCVCVNFDVVLFWESRRRGHGFCQAELQRIRDEATELKASIPRCLTKIKYANTI